MVTIRTISIPAMCITNWCQSLLLWKLCNKILDMSTFHEKSQLIGGLKTPSLFEVRGCSNKLTNQTTAGVCFFKFEPNLKMTLPKWPV